MLIEPGQEGGCQCGAIRYRLVRAPVAQYACHLWTKSAQPWLTPLLENSQCFETEPDSEEIPGLRG